VGAERLALVLNVVVHVDAGRDELVRVPSIRMLLFCCCLASSGICFMNSSIIERGIAV